MRPGVNRPYDLIAIDLDGTLLDDASNVPERNRAALHRAHAAGMHVVLCTGRAFPETQSTIAALGLDLDTVVSVFGAVVTDVRTRTTLHYTPLDPQIAREVTHWFAEHDYAVLWLFDPDPTGVEGYVIRGARRHLAVDGYVALSPCRIEEVDAPPPAGPAPARVSIVDDPGDLADLAPQLRDRFGDRVAFNLLAARAWNFTVIEVFHPHVNKWFGIEHVCRRFGVDPRRTIAFGDDTNDIAMLKHAGLGVAMGNARDEIKAIADRVTGVNNDAGVAAFLETII